MTTSNSPQPTRPYLVIGQRRRLSAWDADARVGAFIEVVDFDPGRMLEPQLREWCEADRRVDLDFGVHAVELAAAVGGINGRGHET